MPWFFKYLNGGHFKMNKAGDPPAGGGGQTPPDPNAKPPAGGAPAGDDWKAKFEAAQREIEALKNPKPAGGGAPPDPNDLSEKARKEREAKDKEKNYAKQLESAIRFTHAAPEWLKTNEALLPKTVQGIFDAANKETYESPIDKDSAIKLGIITEYFTLQENVDLLTPAQKQSLEDFQKLTKNVKLERAQGFYDQVFEPTFETAKKIKKASEVSKGTKTESSQEEAYKKKMISGSKKQYLGEK